MISDGNKFLVSAIVSTYCAEQYIAGCLEDLEAQTIADRLEIIVVNSGSPQNEDAVIKEFQKKYDNIRYIKTEQRETIYAAWNRAVKISSGRYITNANTDDRHRKDALEIMAKVLDENPDKALVYANQNVVKPHKGRNIPVGEGNYGYYLRHRLLTRELDVGSQPLWRRTLHDEFGYFDETFFVAGDTEFWLRVSQRYDFLYLNMILGERLFRPDGVWLSEKDGICELEKTILLICFQYALEKHVLIDREGISGHPVFSKWHEVNLWKRRVHDKIFGISTELLDNIRNVRDLRKDISTSLTVIIVANNRPSGLLENIRALRHQSEQCFEVIVVNNGEAFSKPEEISRELEQGICLIEMKNNYGPSLSRNLALSFSRSDYVAFLDDDAVAHRDFVKNIMNAFKEYDICGLRGKILPKEDDLSPDAYNPGDEVMPAACDTTGNSAFKKSVVLELGGFNQGLFYFDGSELSYRIYRSRNNDPECFLYIPGVIVYHDYYKDGRHIPGENIRRMTAEKMLGQRDPELLRYLQFMDGFYSQKRYDLRYRKFISWFKLYEDRDSDKALGYIRKAVEANPFEYLGYYHLGLLYMKRGDFHQAAHNFEKAITILEQMMCNESEKLIALRNRAEINDCYCSSSTKLANALVSAGKPDRAAEVLTRLLHNSIFRISDKQRTEVRQWMDKYHDLQARTERERLGRAIELNRQGEELFEKGDARGALNAFASAVRTAPQYATTYNNIGVLLLQEGKNDEAMEYFAEALKRDPVNRETVINCGRALTCFNSIDDARSVYLKFLEKNPDDKEISRLLAAL